VLQLQDQQQEMEVPATEGADPPTKTFTTKTNMSKETEEGQC